MIVEHADKPGHPFQRMTVRAHYKATIGTFSMSTCIDLNLEEPERLRDAFAVLNGDDIQAIFDPQDLVSVRSLLNCSALGRYRQVYQRTSDTMLGDLSCQTSTGTIRGDLIIGGTSIEDVNLPLYIEVLVDLGRGEALDKGLDRLDLETYRTMLDLHESESEN